MEYAIGDRVSLKKEALSLSYVMSRKSYTNMYEGKKGTVIGYSSTGKVAVQFDDIVFDKAISEDIQIISSHDNGCHGKGKIHYCWYVPDVFLSPLNDNFELLLLL